MKTLFFLIVIFPLCAIAQVNCKAEERLVQILKRKMDQAERRYERHHFSVQRRESYLDRRIKIAETRKNFRINYLTSRQAVLLLENRICIENFGNNEPRCLRFIERVERLERDKSRAQVSFEKIIERSNETRKKINKKLIDDLDRYNLSISLHNDAQTALDECRSRN